MLRPRSPQSPDRGSRSRPDDPRPLVFSPLAWLQWQYLCHAGPTEVAAFGLSADGDPLRVEELLVVRQRATEVTVAFDDAAVADLFDRMTDAGVAPARFARIWLHTHPGASVVPSGPDEATFAGAFGGCDWAIMGILGRTGRTSARLRFAAGPGGDLELPVAVDWSLWPLEADALGEALLRWQGDFALVEVAPPALIPFGSGDREFRFRDPFEEILHVLR